MGWQRSCADNCVPKIEFGNEVGGKLGNEVVRWKRSRSFLPGRFGGRVRVDKKLFALREAKARRPQIDR